MPLLKKWLTAIWIRALFWDQRSGFTNLHFVEGEEKLHNKGRIFELQIED